MVPLVLTHSHLCIAERRFCQSLLRWLLPRASVRPSLVFSERGFPSKICGLRLILALEAAQRVSLSGPSPDRAPTSVHLHAFWMQSNAKQCSAQTLCGKLPVTGPLYTDTGCQGCKWYTGHASKRSQGTTSHTYPTQWATSARTSIHTPGMLSILVCSSDISLF